MSPVALIALTGFAFAIASLGCGLMAWDFGVRWLAERASIRVQENVLGELSRRLDEHDRAQKMLAEDWRKKFMQLEQDWKRLKEHADSQYAGAVAQQVAQTSRGFGR